MSIFDFSLTVSGYFVQKTNPRLTDYTMNKLINRVMVSKSKEGNIAVLCKWLLPLTLLSATATLWVPAKVMLQDLEPQGIPFSYSMILSKLQRELN